MVRKAELPNVQEITPDAVSLSQDADWKIFPLTRLWDPIAAEHRTVPGDMAGGADHPALANCHVLDSGAGQATAATPRPV